MTEPKKRKKVRRNAPDAGKNREEKAAAVDGLDDDSAVFLTPTEFIRWLADQGVTLSRKSLYKTYFGKKASHRIHTSSDGKKIHKFKGLEMIRIVQGGEGVDQTAKSIAERLAAAARFQTARARQEEIALEEMERTRVQIGVVEKVWARMWENVNNETRTACHNLPKILVGKTQAEIRAALEQSFHQIFSHLAATCRDHVTKPA